jgi:hypothetical protein
MLTLNGVLERGRARSPLVRLMIYDREVFRVPDLARELTVVAGRAWVTMDAHDLVVEQGDTLPLSADGNGVLVSPVGSDPLVVEAWA